MTKETAEEGIKKAFSPRLLLQKNNTHSLLADYSIERGFAAEIQMNLLKPDIHVNTKLALNNGIHFLSRIIGAAGQQLPVEAGVPR